MGLKKYEEGQETSLEEQAPVEELKELDKWDNVKEESEEPKPMDLTESELVNEINATREVYKAEAGKQKKINYLTTAGMVIVLVGAFIMVWANSELTYLTYAGFGIMGLCLVGSYFLTQHFKKTLGKKAENYIKQMFEKSSNYIYNNGKNKDVEVLPLGKLEDKVFVDGHFYTGIKGTRSRNLTNFERKGNKYSACDLAGNTLVKGRLSPKFLGKFYYIEFAGNYDHTIMLQMKGGSLSVKVDDCEGLNCIEDNDTFVMYSDDAEAKKVIDSKVLGLFKKFKIQDPIVDVIFSVKGNKICLGIDYVDNFLNIPVDTDFKIDYTRQTKIDFEKVYQIVEEVVLNVKKVNNEK